MTEPVLSLLIKDDRGTVSTTALVFTANLSQAVPVAGTGLALRVSDAGLPGDAWSLVIQGRPTGDLGQILRQLETVGAPAIDQLFGLAPAEPYLSWRNLWQSRRPLPERLGAVLLAVAARTAELQGVA